MKQTAVYNFIQLEYTSNWKTYFLSPLPFHKNIGTGKHYQELYKWTPFKYFNYSPEKLFFVGCQKWLVYLKQKKFSWFIVKDSVVDPDPVGSVNVELLDLNL